MSSEFETSVTATEAVPQEAEPATAPIETVTQDETPAVTQSTDTPSGTAPDAVPQGQPPYQQPIYRPPYAQPVYRQPTQPLYQQQPMYVPQGHPAPAPQPVYQQQPIYVPQGHPAPAPQPVYQQPTYMPQPYAHPVPPLPADVNEYVEKAFSKALGSLVMAQFPFVCIVALIFSIIAHKTINEASRRAKYYGIPSLGGKAIAARVISAIGLGMSISATVSVVLSVLYIFFIIFLSLITPL